MIYDYKLLSCDDLNRDINTPFAYLCNYLMNAYVIYLFSV